MLRFGPVTIGGLLMTAVLVNAADYSFLVPLRDTRIEAHRQVVEHTAPAPGRYRILVPVALDPLIRVVATVMPHDKAFGRVYAVFHFAALTLLLALLVYELRLWFTLEQAMVGALLVGSTIRIALRQGEYLDMSSIPLDSVFAPHSLLEPTFVAAAVVLSLENRRWPLAILTVVAALNSEAGVLVPLVYLAIRGADRLSLKTTLALIGVWAAVWIAIRFALGISLSPGPAVDIWRENATHLSTTAVNVVLFIGPLWVLAAIGFARAPAPVTRTALLLPLYLSVVILSSFWWDVRVLMGLYPVLMPLVLSAMFVPRAAVS